MSLLKKINFIIVVGILISSCTPSPNPINYGRDNCDHCRMLISDQRFGAELVTGKGKVYKFDSIECLAAFTEKFDENKINSLWVSNFSSANKLIDTRNSFFLRSPEIKSPMGLNLSAYNNQSDLDEIKNKFNGKQLTWDEVLSYVSQEWN